MPYLLIVDRNSQEHENVLRILEENKFSIKSPPSNYSLSCDMVVFLIHEHNARAVVKFVNFENYDLWCGSIYNFITFKVFNYLFKKRKKKTKKTHVWVDEAQSIIKSKE